MFDTGNRETTSLPPNLLARLRPRFISIVFFFSSRRRHTRYWRDWSSDVCSSDLAGRRGSGHGRGEPRAAITHMVGFNYRFVPAVRHARDLIHDGQLGSIYHFRARYLQDWQADPTTPHTWRLTQASAGSGALGDLGSHVVDLARFLVGEPTSVSASLRTFTTDRPGGKVDVDDAFVATIEFSSGAMGTIEASRVATGNKNGFMFEVNGSAGSLR